MALETHERVSTFIEATSPRGYRITAVSLVGGEAKYAQHLVDTGHTNVMLVVEKSTWRGKNGKVKRERLSETPIA